jgi:hypothetical protein
VPDQGVVDEVTKFGSGFLGSLVSLRFLKGESWLGKATLVCGGAALAYFAAPALGRLLHMDDALGLTGFMLGLFGMAVATKLYEVIQGFNAAEVAAVITNWVKKRFGG